MPVNQQDRNKQPLRAGGNCADKPSESHGSRRGEAIEMEPFDIHIGEAAPGRRAFRGHGDDTHQFHGNHPGGGLPDTSFCKHDQPKDRGKLFRGGKLVGEAPVVDSVIQVSERRHGAGNNPDGGHEHQTKGKSRISADINRN